MIGKERNKQHPAGGYHQQAVDQKQKACDPQAAGIDYGV
jgi:hypothetical protein